MDKIAQQETVEKGLLGVENIETSFKQDTLKKRYIYKLGANLFGLSISFITQAIIPRGLGPKAYGDFNFLTNFFTQFVGFLDMGTSTAFYTKLSQRPKESSLVSFFLYIVGIISIGTFGLVLLTIVTSTYSRLWPEQDIFYIYLAAGWGVINWLIMVLNMMADAYGRTVRAELARVFQKVLGLVLIVLLFLFSKINLSIYFYYQYFIFIVLGFFLVWIMREFLLQQDWLLNREQIMKYLHDFYQYSYPLFTYSLVGLIMGLLDRWLLQIYAGSIQQGFYGLSYQIGALCVLFTSAMTPLFMREISIAYGKRDLTKMAELFHRYIPLLYSIAAFFSCFIAVQADKVVYIFGGDKFKGAATAVAIMAFYPLHQTYGQLSGSIFLATDQTHLYRNIGLVLMMIGLPITYFMIAPREQWGLGIGANGLAVKMVFLNLTWVNVQLYFNSRYLKFSFRRYLGHQIFSVVCLLTGAYIAITVVDRTLISELNIINRFILSGCLYTIMVAGLGYSFPAVFGLNKKDVKRVLKLISIRLRD